MLDTCNHPTATATRTILILASAVPRPSPPRLRSRLCARHYTVVRIELYRAVRLLLVSTLVCPAGPRVRSSSCGAGCGSGSRGRQRGAGLARVAPPTPVGCAVCASVCGSGQRDSGSHGARGLCASAWAGAWAVAWHASLGAAPPPGRRALSTETNTVVNLTVVLRSDSKGTQCGAALDAAWQRLLLLRTVCFVRL